ncbi:MAG TPA: L,D-transpeptidase family protein [Gemmatimonadaceae bacterium]|nr:L,D-transpeptidase family protein [Gemmatimonadaceae bacterium]
MKLLLLGRRSGTFIALLCAVLLACEARSTISDSRNDSGATQRTPPRDQAVRGVPIADIRTAIDSLLRASPPASIDADTWRHVRGLYRGNEGDPYWMTAKGLDRQRASQLSNVVVASVEEALNPGELPLAATVEALDVVRGRQTPTAGAIARADVLMTALYAGIAEQRLVGHVDPRSVFQSWYIDPREERVDSAMARMLRAPRLDQALDSMRPRHDAYNALRTELDRYRRLVAAGGWKRLDKGPALSPGDNAPASRLAALRERLRASGLLDSRERTAKGDTTAGRIYDNVLAGAVAQFQARHGIVVDSILGAETVDALNVPAEYRAAQIAGNLERYRWLPQSLGGRYILVNVPAFQLQAFDNGAEVLTMKVIVGAEYDGRSTPVFSDSLQTVVFRPYWNVTENIAENEIWPKAEADPSYMARNNYEVVRGEEGPRVRQKPGPQNALGLVKFMFPNSFDIYLHDTPQGELFEEDVRAFSHGCIRVEKPAELAQYVLGWPADSVQRLMEGEKDDRHVAVEQKIPVYIVYMTSYVRDGVLHFGNDLYSRDQALVAAVRAAALPDASVLSLIQRLDDVASRWRFRWPFSA